MKRLLLSLIIISAFISCSDDEGENLDNRSTWELYKYSTPQSTWTDFPFEETIILYNNATFEKVRVTTDETIESTGTYYFEYKNDRTFVYLEHAQDSDLIFNCQNDFIEFYEVLSSDEMINWASACDWPTMHYR